MAGAVQLVLQTDLSTSRSLVPIVANDTSGSYFTGAKQVLRTTITERENRFHLSATLTDNSTQKANRFVELQGPASSGILPLLNQLAKSLSDQSTPFSTSNDRALKAFIAAASTTEAQQRIVSLQDAVSIDPAFGVAYIDLAELEAQAAPQQLPALIATASHHQSSFTPFDRVRYDAFLASYSHASIAKQQTAFTAVLRMAPNQPDALVNLGTICFLNGDAARGTSYFERAIQLNPGNTNIQRAFAEGLIETRHFAQAEKILVDLDNNLSVLPQLAFCVWFEGDPPRANMIASRLFASIPNSDARTLYQAVWLQLTGQASKANDLLASAHFTQPATQAIAYSELAMWQLQTGNFPAARFWAAKALATDPRPGCFGSIVTLLSAANGPADAWKQQVDSSFIANSARLKEQALGYGFFLGGHYPEAEQVWKNILEQSGGADLRARAMLASTLTHERKLDPAHPVTVEPFVPEFGDLYASISFAEMHRDLTSGVRR